MTASKDDEPQDPGDIRLGAPMAAADDSMLTAIKGAVDLESGFTQAQNAAMRALYRQLDEQALPGDPPFDVEAGLRDLKERLAVTEDEDGELAAYLDWPVTVKVGGIWCENGRECPNPRCDGNGSTEIRAGIWLSPRELLGWVRKHAEEERKP